MSNEQRKHADPPPAPGARFGGIPVSVLTLLGLAGLIACGAATARACETDISEALERLLEKQDRGWAFVVAEDPTSRKYVQYGGDGGGIFIDLPKSALVHGETERAAAIFAEAGVEDPVEVEATDPATGEAYRMDTYQLVFGTDVPRAARFGCRVMREVYRVEGVDSLLITEGE